MEIMDARYLISNADYRSCPKPDRPEYAFIGRSNVGKSSLINMLCHNSKLAKTSSTPGKTQLINHFDITSTGKRKWYLVDLPGYGFARVSQKDRRKWEEMINGYIRRRENLVTLFVLIDGRHLPQRVDIDFINQLGEWKVPFTLVFTKTDKNKDGKTTRHVSAFMDELKQFWDEPPSYFISSSILCHGREEILAYIGSLNDRLLSG
jgi:GTP-binding protein